MRPPGLTESPPQYVIVGVEENESRNQPFFKLFVGLRELLQRLPLANVDGDSSALFGFVCQVGKFGQQSNGKVVDGIVAQILERFQRGQLTGTTDSGNYHQVGS